MRMFLPIKGPGGRYLTNKEKVALLVLGLTLVLSVLTVLAGERAYVTEPAQNPVFGLVGALCRTLGGGIVALYALVLVWSGLLYFKGEKIADVSPFGGRLFAAVAVTIGVSGALGIAHLQTAGDLGLIVGRALDRTFGAGVGFPILIGLMLLGVHLAGQGAWHAMREPMAAAAGTAARPRTGFSLDPLPERRFQGAPDLPDDGDPSADERTLAVTQAMEEIERSQGVTIVDVEPGREAPPEEEVAEEQIAEEAARPSIGEEVEAAPPPPDDSEEAQVREGLREVRERLERRPPPADDDEAHHHGLIPVPPEEAAAADAEQEARAAEPDGEDERVRTAPPLFTPPLEYAEDESPAALGAAPAETEARAGPEEAVHEEEAPAAEEVAAQADGFVEEEEDEDPYARGGLLKRMQQTLPFEGAAEDDRPFTNFDWRGRPLR